MLDQKTLEQFTDKRFQQTPGLNDLFSDIGEVVESGWNTIKSEGQNAVTGKVKDLFGTGNSQPTSPQTSYDQMNKVPMPQQEQNTSVEQKAKTFIQKVPPIVVGASTTAVVKYVGKFGWVTSIVAGVGAGAAKHFLIDKKQGVQNG